MSGTSMLRGPSDIGASKNCKGAITTIAPPRNCDQPRTLDLPPIGFATQLMHRLNDMAETLEVTMRQKSAVCVNGQLAANTNFAISDQISATSGGCKAGFFQLMQNFKGEAVVNHCRIHVFGT